MRGIQALATALLVALLAAWPRPAAAWQIQVKEWGGGAQYTTDFSLKHSNLQSTGALVYASTPLWQSASLRLEGRLEGQLAKFWNYSSGVEMALVPALRLYLTANNACCPSLYAEAGIGPSYNTLNVKELGMGFNFLSFAGLGLRLPLTKTMSFDMGYRMRHISNAGLDEANGGVSSHQFMLELGLAY